MRGSFFILVAVFAGIVFAHGENDGQAQAGGRDCGSLRKLNDGMFRWGAHRADIKDIDSPEAPKILVMSEKQNIVPDSNKIDAIKRKMRGKYFDYALAENAIGGYFLPSNKIYSVEEGHHRLAAALEIAYEDLNWTPFKKLMENGKWDIRDKLTTHECPLPLRDSYLTNEALLKTRKLITPSWVRRFFQNLFSGN